MPKYALSAVALVPPAAVAYRTALKIASVSTLSIELVFLNVGGSGSAAAADNQFEGSASQLSAAGAGTLGSTVTGLIPSKGNRTAAGIYTLNYSAEPTTYVASPFLLFSWNQRAGWSWGVPEGQGWTADFAQTNAHIGVRLRASAAAGVSDLNAHVVEP